MYGTNILAYTCWYIRWGVCSVLYERLFSGICINKFAWTFIGSSKTKEFCLHSVVLLSKVVRLHMPVIQMI